LLCLPASLLTCPALLHSPLPAQMLEEFRQEISIMKRLRHPHIVQFVSGDGCLLRPPAGAPAAL
jgi:serine/threonine protein kinase